jgi:transcriptional regulator with XRE-family HTH domain
MADLTRNVRFLLWKNGIAQEEWGRKLAEWLGCPERRAEELLEGYGGTSSLTSKEKKALAAATGLQPEDLSADLLRTNAVNVFAENVCYLVGSLPHGAKKEFAKKIGVDATTVSRWIASAHRPGKKKIDELCRYFGLPAGTNLDVDAIFLSSGPVSESQMRRWIVENIESIDGKNLREIFPSLRRLLR